MPNTIGKGVVEVVYDKDQAEKSARDAIIPGLHRVAGDMVGVFAGKKIFDFAKQGFAELGEAQKVAALTTSTIKATGGAANVTAEQVSGLAGSLSELSGKDDELIQSGENLLLTFKAVQNQAGAGNDIFDQATKAALNLSTAGFGSMESASVMLGKALQDPIKGVTALQRVGVSLTQAQKDQVKAFVESGDVLSAQKVILGEVEAQVGGAAEAYGQTLPGQLERANNAMDEAKAAMVGGLAPALSIGADLAVSLSEKFQELPEGMQQVIGATALVGGGIGALARPVGDAIRLFQLMKPAAEAAAVAEGALTTANEGVAASSGAAAAGQAGFLAAAAPFVVVAAAGAVALEGLAQSFHIAGQSGEHFSLTLKEGAVPSVEDFKASLADVDKAAGLTGRSLADVAAGIAAQSIPAARNFNDALREQGRSTDEVTAAIDKQEAASRETDAATKGLTVAELDAADAADAQAAAVKALHDTLHASIDPLFAMQSALVANAAAQADLTEKEQSGSATAAELEAAHLKVAESALGVYDAQLDLTAAMDAGTISIGGAKLQLAEWVRQGLLSQESANAVAEALQRDIDKANELDGKNVALTITTYENTVSHSGGRTFVNGEEVHAASGFAGTIDRSTWLNVGEGGEPEDVLIVPHSKGGIAPEMFDASGGGETVIVNVAVHGYLRDKRAMDELGRAVAEPVQRVLLKKQNRTPAGSIGLG